MEKRNVRVSAGAEALSVLGLVLAVVTVISPFWGRFSNEGNPNTGGKSPFFFPFLPSFLIRCFSFTTTIIILKLREKERKSKEKRKRYSNSSNTLLCWGKFCVSGKATQQRTRERRKRREMRSTYCYLFAFR